jgi:secreted Zn-dependent insulinase-like peptidase
MSVRISGYDDRQAVLLERILAALTEPKLDPKRFAILHAELKRGLENSRRDQPYGLAMKRLRNLLVDPNWTVVERLAVIDSVSATELERFARHLLSRLEVVALVHGNVDAARAEELGERLHASLVVPARPVEVPRGRIMRLRRGDRLAAQVKVEHPESAVALYLQAPRKSIADRAGAGLLAQVLGSPFFDALRTEKKLGYVVFANALPILDSAGVVFIVQSPVAGAGMLQDEVRGFLNGYRERIAAMTEAEFAQHKKALTARVMEEERQLGERSDRFWSEIDRGNFEFDTRERLARAIAGTSIEAFRALYDAMLDDERRRQIAVRAQGADTPASPPRAGAERVVTPVWARENRELLPG